MKAKPDPNAGEARRAVYAHYALLRNKPATPPSTQSERDRGRHLLDNGRGPGRPPFSASAIGVVDYELPVVSALYERTARSSPAASVSAMRSAVPRFDA